MTKKELLEAIKDFPDDEIVYVYSDEYDSLYQITSIGQENGWYVDEGKNYMTRYACRTNKEVKATVIR